MTILQQENAARALRALLSWSNKNGLFEENRFLIDQVANVGQFFNEIIRQDCRIEGVFDTSPAISERLREMPWNMDRFTFADVISYSLARSAGQSVHSKSLLDKTMLLEDRLPGVGSRDATKFLAALPFTRYSLRVNAYIPNFDPLEYGRDFIQLFDMAYKDGNKYVISMDNFLYEVADVIKAEYGIDLTSSDRYKWAIGGFLSEKLEGDRYSEEGRERTRDAVRRASKHLERWTDEGLLDCLSLFHSHDIDENDLNSLVKIDTERKDTLIRSQRP